MAKSDKAYRVLFLYRAVIPSIEGLHMLLDTLRAMGRIDYRFLQEMRVTTTDLDWADVILLGRFDSWYEARLTKILRKSKDTVVYYIDDDILNLPVDIGSADYYRREDVRRHIFQAISLSNAVLSPSPLLLEKYAGDGRIPVLFQSTAFQTEPYRPRERNKPIRIGFAGSLDRVVDLEGYLAEALFRAKKRYRSGIRIDFFGVTPPFAERLGAECIGYIPDYRKFREVLNGLEWDIGLAPMPDTAFHSCKHFNKFLEYGGSAIAVIYSDCAPYTRIPRRDERGRFCENTAEAWYRAICDEIEDHDARELHRKNSSECVRQEFDLKKVSLELFDALENVLCRGRNNGKVAHRQILFPMKLGNIWLRGTGYVQRKGLKATLAALGQLYRKTGKGPSGR